eukprot:SAG22_NODE_709_length_7742_cov_2.383488_8_plen_761_part_00
MPSSSRRHGARDREMFENPVADGAGSDAGVAARVAAFETELKSPSPRSPNSAAAAASSRTNSPHSADQKPGATRKRTDGQKHLGTSNSRRARLACTLRTRQSQPADTAELEDEDEADERVEPAGLMWRRIFNIVDKKNTHSLQEAELREGIWMVQEFWQRMSVVYDTDATDFARCGSSSASTAVLQALQVKVAAMDVRGIIGYARACGLDEDSYTLPVPVLATKIADTDGSRALVRREVETLSDELLEARAQADGVAVPPLPTLESVESAATEANGESNAAAWRMLTAGTVYVAGITEQLEKPGRLLEVMQGTFGDTTFAELRVRERPLKSWALVTFSAPASHDMALGDEAARARLAEEFGIEIKVVNHDMARAGTGDFGAVWRRCREAISGQVAVSLARQMWREHTIAEIVSAAPERRIMQQVQAEVDVQLQSWLQEHLESAGQRLVKNERLQTLAALASEQIDASSTLWAGSHGKVAHRVRAELESLSFAGLLERARKLEDDPMMKEMQEHVWDGHRSENGLDQLLRAVLRTELRVELRNAIEQAEANERSSLVRKRAQAAGLDETDLVLPRSDLINVILRSQLDNLCPATVCENVLLPCIISVSKSLGGKLPNNVPLCLSVEDLLNEDSEAIKIPVYTSRRVKSEGLHPVYDALLDVLSDPFLSHFIVPQLEHWLEMFTTMDIVRDGLCPFTDLQQGLQTSCAPEIDIVQTCVMVDQLVEAIQYVMQERDMLDRAIELTCDNLSEHRLSIIYRVRAA